MQMPHHVRRTALTVVATTILASAAASAQQPGRAAGAAAAHPTPDWAAVERVLGRKGAALPGHVMKYGFPRTDLSITVHGVHLKPAFALGGWVAFKDVGNGRVMAMGDLVLTESEVEPVMRALQQGGVDLTALHNHLLWETPRLMYMHIDAHGDPVKIAEAVRDALGKSGTPLAPPSSPAPAAAIDLDTAAVARALGVPGAVNGGVYQVSVPRRDTIREGHDVIPPAMGVATGINFQPTGGGNAAITGDFVLRASEVNAVIRALQESGIAVTGLHSHMLQDEPRLFFMHFWATGNAVALARGLRRALDHTATSTTLHR